MKISLVCYFFDLIAKKYEIYKTRKWTQFWHEMLKIASVSGAEPRPHWGSLRRSPRPLSRKVLPVSAIATSRLQHHHTFNRDILSTFSRGITSSHLQQGYLQHIFKGDSVIISSSSTGISSAHL